MRMGGDLLVVAGHASDTGRRPDNQDFVGIYSATDSERLRHGMLVAVADGVGGGKAGRMAAELAVRALIDGLYDQPDTIGTAAAAARVLGPYNRWLNTMAKADTMAHTATTLTALVLKGRRGHVIHVGDSRAWLFRDGRLTLLTTDHCHSHPDQQHILYRALGIEERLRLDHHEVTLAVHDRLLLTSDGLHGTLSHRQIEKLLGLRGSAASDVQHLVDAAVAGGSHDNVSAVLVDVVALPAPDLDLITQEIAGLPILAAPDVGESIDGYRMEALLSDGRYTRLFRARDTTTGQIVVIKFPKPPTLSESGARLAFARELLVGSRVVSPFVGAIIAVPVDRQTRLYGVQPFHAGETLEMRLKHPVPLEQGLAIATQLTRAVAALHRLRIVHRDIKPENLILEPGGSVKLIDLGVARLPRVDDFTASEIPGTPSYLAPEMYSGNHGDEATDQFALGVTLWRLFAGRYPYGEVEAFARPRFAALEPPSRLRPELPAWLDQALMRTVSINPADRFGDIIELLRALEGGAAVARTRLYPIPLIEKYPVRFWQVISLALLIALLVSLKTR
jgi:serine/threonine protein phosphatase PrpC